MNLYIKIAKDIKKLIIENKVPSGGKLPSINSLCKKYNCSKGTIIKAYDTLCKEHLVYSFPQSGFYVVDSMMREDDGNSSVYDLSSGNPTINSTPIQEIKHCLNTAIELYSTSSLELSLAGSPSLSKTLSKHLAREHVYCNTKNIYLSQGILQVLTILSKMPFPNSNDTILIEEPTYSFFVGYLKFKNNNMIIGNDLFTFSKGAFDFSITTIQYKKIQLININSSPLKNLFKVRTGSFSCISDSFNFIQFLGCFKENSFNKLINKLF